MSEKMKKSDKVKMSSRPKNDRLNKMCIRDSVYSCFSAYNTDSNAVYPEAY